MTDAIPLDDWQHPHAWGGRLLVMGALYDDAFCAEHPEQAIHMTTCRAFAAYFSPLWGWLPDGDNNDHDHANPNQPLN
jgi:hypothetical protein